MKITVCDRGKVIEKYGWAARRDLFISVSEGDIRISVDLPKQERKSCKVFKLSPSENFVAIKIISGDMAPELYNEHAGKINGRNYFEVIFYRRFYVSVFDDALEQIFLAGIDGSIYNREYAVPFRVGRHIIGRGGGEESGSGYILVEGPGISSKQAEMTVHYPNVYFRNGAKAKNDPEKQVVINGERISGEEVKYVKTGDRIKMGEGLFCLTTDLGKEEIAWKEKKYVRKRILLSFMISLVSLWFLWKEGSTIYALRNLVSPEDLKITGVSVFGRMEDGEVSLLNRSPMIVTEKISSYVERPITSVLWNYHPSKTSAYDGNFAVWTEGSRILIKERGREKEEPNFAVEDEESPVPEIDGDFVPSAAGNGKFFLRSMDYALLELEADRKVFRSLETYVYTPVSGSVKVYNFVKKGFAKGFQQDIDSLNFNYPMGGELYSATNLFLMKRKLIAWAGLKGFDGSKYKIEITTKIVLSIEDNPEDLSSEVYHAKPARSDIPLFPQFAFAVDINNDDGNELIFFNDNKNLRILYEKDGSINARTIFQSSDRGFEEITPFVIGDVSDKGFKPDGYQEILFGVFKDGKWRKCILSTNLFFPVKGLALWPRVGGDVKNSFSNYINNTLDSRETSAKRICLMAFFALLFSVLLYPRRRRIKEKII